MGKHKYQHVKDHQEDSCVNDVISPYVKMGAVYNFLEIDI